MIDILLWGGLTILGVLWFMIEKRV